MRPYRKPDASSETFHTSTATRRTPTFHRDTREEGFPPPAPLRRVSSLQDTEGAAHTNPSLRRVTLHKDSGGLFRTRGTPRRDPLPDQDTSKTFGTPAITRRIPALHQDTGETLGTPAITRRIPALHQDTGAFHTRETSRRPSALAQETNVTPRARETLRRAPTSQQEVKDAFHTRETPRRMPALQQDDKDGTWQANEENLTDGDLWFISGTDRNKQNKPLFHWNGMPVSAEMLARLAVVPVLALLLLSMQGMFQQAAQNCIGRQNPSCLSMSIIAPPAGQSQPAAQPTATPKPDDGPSIPAIPDDLPGNVHDFLELAMPYAVRAHQETGWPTSVILAQWGLEHGWSVPDYTGYNWGNSGAIEGFPTVPGIDVPGSPSAFAYAETPEDGLQIYLHVSKLDYYVDIAPAAKNGADAAAVALGESPWDAGHYTDSGNPGSSLLEIMKDFNFYRFDTD